MAPVLEHSLLDSHFKEVLEWQWRRLPESETVNPDSICFAKVRFIPRVTQLPWVELDQRRNVFFGGDFSKAQRAVRRLTPINFQWELDAQMLFVPFKISSLMLSPKMKG